MSSCRRCAYLQGIMLAALQLRVLRRVQVLTTAQDLCINRRGDSCNMHLLWHHARQGQRSRLQRRSSALAIAVVDVTQPVTTPHHSCHASSPRHSNMIVHRRTRRRRE